MEKFLFSHVKVWVFLLVLIFGSIGAFAFSSLAVKGAQGEHRFGGLSQLAYKIVAAPDVLKSFFVDGHIAEDRFPDEVGGFTLAVVRCQILNICCSPVMTAILARVWSNLCARVKGIVCIDGYSMTPTICGLRATIFL